MPLLCQNEWFHLRKYTLLFELIIFCRPSIQYLQLITLVLNYY